MSKRTGTNRIRILLADDHLVVRMGIASLISYESDMAVVGEAETGLEAVALARELKPDIVIMDLMMPKLNGAEAAERIRKSDPDVRILVLTSFGTSPDIRRALNAGATGVLLKSSSQEDILSAIRSVMSGTRIVSPEIASTLSLTDDRPELSARQIEVLNLAAKGFSNADIARILGISVNSVKDHLKLIYSRLGVATRTEATALALNRNLITG